MSIAVVSVGKLLLAEDTRFLAWLSMVCSWAFSEVSPPVTLSPFTDSSSALRFLQYWGLLLPPQPATNAVSPMSSPHTRSHRVTLPEVTTA